ncbi:hypothetical protein G7Z17_g10814 [Cylindrodendrum hubeiense]|uniref:Saccharopine dehydrogenase NADP binding domain-containing protein n=1 Tax=Cylindrodendrum hubeiense TaxID=595255 RepID=A0A9P5H6F2_9HYPO|nr:hypothetical protein G7Z17_g10814 [Cylindrodendrum hubeiense]
MPIKEHGRQYDIVVFGATGYTGKLTAEYITTNLPTDLKWAIAGRSESKLQAVVDECKRLNSDRLAPAIEIANLNDEGLSALTKKTCVLLTTVGPYALYGEHAFKACAENGTHYVDVTGEAAWVNRMIKKYEKTAKESGATLFPQAGVESAPPDLTTWALAKAIRTQLGAPTKDVKLCIHNIRDSILEKIFGVRTIPNLGMLTTSPMGSTDIAVVERTWGLLSETPSRKDQFYGPKFTWGEYLKTRNWLSGVVTHWMMIIGMTLLALVPPVRTVIKRYIFQPGEGASREATEKEEIEYRGVAYPDSEKATGKIAYCRTWHRGGMYYLTGKLLVETAATILEDDNELDGGIYTPACLGQGLIDRLDKAGLKFEVKLLDA